MSFDPTRVAPYAELEPVDRAILASAWRHLAEHGIAIEGAALRFAHAVDKERLNHLQRLSLLHGFEDKWRSTLLGALFLDEARPTLQAIDRLLRMAHDRYRPGGGSLGLESIREALGSSGIHADLLRLLLGDLDLRFQSFQPLVLELDEAAFGLQDLTSALRKRFAHCYQSAPPSANELPPIPFALVPTALEAARFRALRDVRCELEPLTVLVGPNGVGKSTLLDVAGFIRQALTSGLEKALQNQGGLLRLRTRGEDGPLSVAIEFSVQYPEQPASRGSYAFSCGTLDGVPVVEKETLRLEEEGGELLQLIDAVRGRARVLRSDGFVETRYHAAGTLTLAALSDSESYPLAVYLRSALRQVVLVDRDPMVASGRMAWRTWDERVPGDGSFEEILYPIATDPERTSKLGKVLASLVPTVEGLRRKVVTGEPPVLEVEERGLPGGLHLAELSAGTRQLLLLAALYLHPRPPALLLVEEPDGGVHAGALPALVDLLRSLASRMAVIVTSHSPSFVELLDPRREVRALERTNGGVSLQPLAATLGSTPWLTAFRGGGDMARSSQDASR